MKLKGFHNSIRRMAMVATCVVTVVSCSEAKFDDIAPEEPAATDKVVYLAVPELSLPKVSAATRIAIDNDDYDNKSLSLKWSDGDGFSLWAIADGDEVPDFKNIEFEYVGPEKYPAGENRTLFASNSVPVSFLDGPYNGYSYTYTAFYPHQTDESKVDRTANRVTYEIPTLQNGRYDGKLDIMSAAPAAFSDALTPGVYQEIDLTFRHRTHALKITVPAGNNNFGADVTRLRIEFPQAVAGDLTFDARTGEVADRSGLTENYVDIKFDKPLQEGEPFWVFIAPVEVSGEVKFTAYGGDNEKYQSEPSIAATGQFGSLEAEKITPVKLGIKPGFSVTWFEYEIVDWSRLGEEITMLDITLPEGLQLADRSEDPATRTKKVTADGEGKFRFSFRTAELQRAAEANSFDLNAQFESEHAIVAPYATDAEKFVIAADGYTPDDNNVRTIDYAPYLFEEDFNGITADVSHDDNLSLGANPSYGADTGYFFDNAGLNGWSGARCGAYTDGYVRILNRSQHAGLILYVSGNYRGRIDSPAMQNLTKEARLKVKFDYSMDRERNNNSNFVTHYFAVGTHKTAGTINASSGTSDASLGTTLGDNAIIYDVTTSDFSANIDQTAEYVTNGYCTNENRFVWEVYVNQNLARATANYHNYWLYIDNVKVSIVNE